MGAKEKKIIDREILSCGKWSRLFRANSGMGWIGKIIEKGDNWIKIKNPRPFRGMPEGFSDLFGLASVIVTQEMVGKRIAVFVAKELKTGKIPLTEKQELFGRMVKKLGGIFEVIRD